ncbi:ankyrin [Colletotrichum eremochloae]|nr:ankyrin [Colletotrichum eremochloae]
MGRSVQEEQGRHYGCLDVLSSCFKQPPKARSPSPDTPNARPARVQRPETKPDQPNAPLSTVNVPEEASSAVLNTSDTSASHSMSEISLESHDQPSPDVQQVSDLWAEAFQGLDEEYKKSISANVAFIHDNPAEQLMGLVRDREDKFNDHSAKITIRGREVLWRDCATRVISLLSAAVDIGIQFAPAPGPVVWSALKVLLNAHASGCESLTAIFGCADRVLCLMNRGAIYEQVYLQSRPEEDLDACAKDLRSALINAYQKSLELLDYARTLLKDGKAVSRFFEALWDPPKAKDKLDEFQEAEKSLQEAVTACNIKKQHLQNEKNLRLLKRLNKPLRYIDEKVNKMLTEMGDYELLRTLDFICKIHVGNQHRAITSDKTKGTGEWLSQRKEFREWEDSSSSNVLWLTGKVGAGKSVLTSGIIDRYLVNQNNQGDINEADSNVDEGFAFFYYSKNNKDVTDDPVTNILRSFLRQLAQVPHYANGIFDDLASLCRKMEKTQQAFTPDLCRDKILTLVNALPRTILVLDSLDELEPQHMQEIISFFVNLVNTSERPVKIFVSSRFTTDIYNEVNKANNKPTRMDIAAKNQGDIKRFVLERTMRIDCRWRNEEVRGEVVEKISRDAYGMFRWAFMQIDQLIKYDSPEDVKERLGKLPKGLTAAYDELYAKPGSHDEIYLQRAVKWVMHSQVPLSTEQLLSAVQLGLANEHDDLVPITRTRRLSEQTLENICRYLIVKNDQGDWAFPHASVQEYFVEKHSALTNDNARIEVAKLSLLVLIQTYQFSTATESPDLGQVYHEASGDGDSIVCGPDSEYSLEHYVSKYWASHIRNIQGVPDGSKQISSLLKRFMISPDDPCHSTREYQKWVEYVVSHRGILFFNDSIREKDLMPAKNSAFGIVALGITLDEKEWAENCLKLSLEELHEDGLDTLSLAAGYGHAELCVSLIKLGSNPNRILPSKFSALAQAIGRRKENSIKALLEHGADPNIDLDCRALCRVVRYGSCEIIKLLLEHGALPNGICSQCSYKCALGAAVGFNRLNVAEILINFGATVDLRHNGEYNTHLMAAAHRGSLDIAMLLIKHGADVNIKPEPSRYGGVLGAAFCGWRATWLIPYLIEEAGADPNRIIEDLRERDPWVSDSKRDSRREISKWLFSKKHLDPEKVRDLDYNASWDALGPLINTAREGYL